MTSVKQMLLSGYSRTYIPDEDDVVLGRIIRLRHVHEVGGADGVKVCRSDRLLGPDGVLDVGELLVQRLLLVLCDVNREICYRRQ